jgi:hypothetical protein
MRCNVAGMNKKSDTPDLTSKSEGTELRLDEILKETEEAFQEGLTQMESWSAQANDFLQNSPRSLIAATALSGFVIGTSLRRSRGTPATSMGGASKRARHPFWTDPIFMFATGTLAGFLFGPKLLAAKSPQKGASIDPFQHH